MNPSLLGILRLIFVLAFGELFGAESSAVRLFVREVLLEVLGKEVSVIAIVQEDGTHGYSPTNPRDFTS